VPHENHVVEVVGGKLGAKVGNVICQPDVCAGRAFG